MRVEEMYNEELHELYSWTMIIRVMQSRTARWVGQVTCMRERTNDVEFW
jgi:hypothetical protein